MKNFTRFTPAHQPGDVFVRTDAVISVAEFDYLFGPPLHATSIGTVGNGHVYVKESPAQVIAALDDADIPDEVECDIEIDGDTLLRWSEELQRIHAIKLKPIETPLHDKMRIAKLAHERDEALADAKIADERAEWYKGKAEQMRQCYESEIKRSDVLRAERDQLIAKLKDTTAALEKASAELGQRRYGIWKGDRSSWIACAGDGAAYIKPTPRPD